MNRVTLSFLLFWGLTIQLGQSRDKLAVIMLDGFRWDFVSRMTHLEMPSIKQLIDEGVEAVYVQPVFPSEAFPSWTTIVTGLYPESHGILANYMWDPMSEMAFDIDKAGQSDDNTNHSDWWSRHVPLWITATEKDIQTSLYHWSRCDVSFKEGILPKKCIPFDNSNSFNMSMFDMTLQNAVLDLIQGFDLVMVQNSNFDKINREFGSESSEMLVQVKELDQVVGRFLSSLIDRGIRDTTNIVIVSGFGVTKSVDKDFTSISEFTSKQKIKKIVNRGPFSFIALKDPNEVDQVVDELRAWQGVNVYKRQDIPANLGVKASDLTLDILIVTKGTQLIGSNVLTPNDDTYLPLPSRNEEMGLNGWEDMSKDIKAYEEGNYPDMRSVFIANGPAFKRGYRHQWIKLVDEYQILLHLLQLNDQAEPHNGTWDRVQDMFSGQVQGLVYSPMLVFALPMLAATRWKLADF